MLLRTLFSHYRRHPLQGLFLLVGIVVANVLLSGTLLINAQARASYGQGEQVLSSAPVAQIRHKEADSPVDEADFIRLRRLGFDMLAPVLREVVRTESGAALELLGVDLFAMPRDSSAAAAGFPETDFARFAYPPYQLWTAPARLTQLGAVAGERIALASGRSLPPLEALPGHELGHRMLIDIGALQVLTDNQGRLSSILVFPAAEDFSEALRAALPTHLTYQPGSEAPDPAELTHSFHLNLAAMGLLAFVVGVFLTYNALAFSYTDRRELLRKLRLAGVSRRRLGRALLAELGLFLVAGTLLGSWLGAGLAAALLPGVGQTLAQLYGVYIAYPDALVPAGFWLPPVMTSAAALLCVVFPLREALHAPMLERWQSAWQHGSVLRRDRLMAIAGVAMLAGALVLGSAAKSLWVALAGMASLLLGAALLLPLVLRLLLSACSRLVPARRARLSWLLADSRWLLGPASLALMAMTLALVANSGLNTMIGSFRDATDRWLDQRLAADLYLSSERITDDLPQWLASVEPGLEVGERFRTTIPQLTPAGFRSDIEVVSHRDGQRFRDAVQLIRAEENASADFRAGRGVYISERAWRLDGWQPGELVNLCQDQAALKVPGFTTITVIQPRNGWSARIAFFSVGRRPRARVLHCQAPPVLIGTV
jgi:putative ABC transport system permease protein